jgi:hypothetical protein
MGLKKEVATMITGAYPATWIDFRNRLIKVDEEIQRLKGWSDRTPPKKTSTTASSSTPTPRRKTGWTTRSSSSLTRTKRSTQSRTYASSATRRATLLRTAREKELSMQTSRRRRLRSLPLPPTMTPRERGRRLQRSRRRSFTRMKRIFPKATRHLEPSCPQYAQTCIYKR